MIEIEAENRLGDLLAHIVDLAREAGRAIMAVYKQENPEVELKCDNSPLTRADLASHDVILNGLARLTPDWPVISEESAEVPFDQRKVWRHFWMVDPLDGTKEFISRNGEFTVNIALVEGNMPILGVVYAPAIDDLYFAARGSGAFKVDREGTFRIKAVRAASAGIRTVVSRSHRSQGEDFEGCVRDTGNREIIAMGSSLKFCLVAEGAASVYPRMGPTMEWDTAAAHCILVEAGGQVTDLHGNPMLYNKPSFLNPGFLASGIVEKFPLQAGSSVEAIPSLEPYHRSSAKAHI
jgi:3'(2'), 5'-bisphosphate nucleotidase